MFRKLLKYDVRAVGKLWWIGAVVSLSAAITAAILIRYFIKVIELDTDSIILNLTATFAIFAAMFCIIAVALAFVFTQILVYVRFYKHFFTDEGYLTFTLPVKRSTLFLSKIVNAVIWYSLHIIVITISVLFFATLVTPPEKGGFFINFAALEAIGELIRLLWLEIGAWTIVYAFEMILIAFAYMLYSTLLVHFCITFGAVLVKRAKLLLSIGIYYLISSGIQTIGQFGLYIFGSLLTEGMIILTENVTLNQGCAIGALLLLCVFAALSAIASIFYSVTRHLLDRRLNLA